MKPDIHTINYKSHDILVALDHATACDILKVSGHEIPAIPQGCNTVLYFFKTHDGKDALAVNQKGFTPKASDNEQELNGCTVMIMQDNNCDDPQKILEEFYRS